MRAHVDAGLCQAHGQCNDICPEVFLLDEWGYAYTESDGAVPDGLEQAARRAVTACPERAIRVED